MPFHDGERVVQGRLGERAEADRVGRSIAEAIEPAAARFVAAQSFAVVGSAGADGARWASWVPGVPGFAAVTGGRVLELELTRVHPADPLLANIVGDVRLGVLFLDPVARRRLRINGTATRRGDLLQLTVAEAYPNCPRHVRRRRLRTVDVPHAGAPTRGEVLGAEELALVRAADTCFVASSHPTGHADASHRGGEPGFVRTIDARTLEIPDYRGNHMYNTLGNLLVDPRAGLTFVDFGTGRGLMTTGRADICWEGQRAWRLSIDRWVSFSLPVRAA